MKITLAAYSAIESVKSSAIQLILAKSVDRSITRVLSSNLNISEDVQLNLVKNYDGKDDCVIYNLALNPNISTKTQLILVRSKSFDIRWALSQNPSISKKIQLILAKDDESEVREYLAENIGISKKTQLILAKDKNEDVRSNLAENPIISEKIQLILARDRGEGEYEEGESAIVRGCLAGNDCISHKVQLILAKDENKYVTNRLLENKNLCDEARKIMK